MRQRCERCGNEIVDGFSVAERFFVLNGPEMIDRNGWERKRFGFRFLFRSFLFGFCFCLLCFECSGERFRKNGELSALSERALFECAEFRGREFEESA